MPQNKEFTQEEDQKKTNSSATHGKKGRYGRRSDKYQKRGGGSSRTPNFDRENRGSADNDYGWYLNDNPEMLNNAGSLSFNNPLGAFFDKFYVDPDVPGSAGQEFDGSIQFPAWTALDDKHVPGVLKLNMITALGVSSSGDSPVNVAARKTFSFFQSTLGMKLAPALEPNDVMLYFDCCDNVMAFYAWVSRIYGTIPTASARNQYIGRYVLRCEGLDADDFIRNASEIFFYLQYFRSVVNRTLFLPKDYGFAKRHFWLFSNYFKDAPVEKSQIYMHSPVGFYEWSATEYQTGTAAIFKMVPPGLKTWADIKAIGDALLDAMTNDQDAVSIAGFVLRAYGSDGVVQLPEVPVDYAVFPTYSEEILGQIHNSQALGLSYSTAMYEAAQAGDITLNFDKYQKAGTGATSYIACDYRAIVTGGLQSKSAETPKEEVKDTKFRFFRIPSDIKEPAFDFVDLGGDDEVKTGNVVWDDDGALHLWNACSLMYNHMMDSFVDAPTPQEVIINSRNMMNGRFWDYVDASTGDPTMYMILDDVGLDIIWNYQLFSRTSLGSLSVWELGSVTAGSYANDAVSSFFDVVSKFDWAPRIVILSQLNFIRMGQWIGLSATACGDIWDYNNTTQVSRAVLAKQHVAALLGALNVPMQVRAYTKG